jgi:hypothetical protein
VALLALVSSSIVLTEVLLTRILSLATYYGLAFAVLSLAMLGLSAGSIDAMRAQSTGEPLGDWLGRRLLHFAGAVMLATLVTTGLPITFNANLTSFGSVLLVAAAAAAPLVAGGSLVARLTAESDVPLPVLYAVDLVAAAGGALLPLVLLGPLSGPSALMAVAVMLALASGLMGDRTRRGLAWSAASIATTCILVTELSSAGLVVMYPKGNRRPEGAPVLFQSWNALSNVELRGWWTAPVSAVLWAPSPATPELMSTPFARGTIDGDASTLIHGFSSLSSVDFLRYDLVTAAHRLRPTGTACVIGAGGGRDLLAARVFGHDRVIGVEINPAIVDMLRSVSMRSPLLQDPGVTLIEGDGRAEMAHLGTQCRVLQATLVDTWAATSAGAFAHTEATIYTLEAWRLFLRRVEPDGVLAFSRWYDPAHVEETARLVALAVAALLDRGVAHPRDHIALLGSGEVATILVSPAPFSEADHQALAAMDRDLKYTTLLSPTLAPTGALLDRIVAAPTIDSLGSYGAPLLLDTSAPTDDRPFFFQLRSARVWLHPLDALASSGASQGAIAGNTVAMFQLLVTCFAVLLVGAALLGPTLVRAARSSEPSLPGPRAVVYFGALGAGFMMTEIALVQRMHVVLGHPTYALVVVLAGLLFATGLGSALSPRLLRSERSVSVAAVVAAVVLSALPYAVIRPLAHATLESGLLVRAAWAAGCSGGVGLVLGMFFPAGMRFVSRERGAPLALAINGFTSVLGTTLALILSVWVSIPTTFAAAGALYGLVALVGPVGWHVRVKDRETSPSVAGSPP